MMCALLGYRIQPISPNESPSPSNVSKTGIEPFSAFFSNPIPTAARNEPTVNGRVGG